MQSAASYIPADYFEDRGNPDLRVGQPMFEDIFLGAQQSFIDGLIGKAELQLVCSGRGI